MCKLLIFHSITSFSFAAYAKEERCNVLLVRSLNPSRFFNEKDNKAFAFINDYDEVQAWQNLNNPINFGRQVGFESLREKIRQSGITTVVPGNSLSEADTISLQHLYGTQIAFAGRRIKAQATQLPGVVLHPGNAPLLSQSYRGEINPHLGVGKMYRSLDKWREYAFSENVQPGAMPKTYRFIDLTNAQIETSPFEMEPSELNDKMDKALSALISATEVAFPHEKFPLGSFIKIADEVQTGDSSTILRSSRFEKGKIIREATRELNRFRKSHDWSRFKNSSEVYNEIKSHGNRALHLMAALLLDPQKIIIQEAVPIAKTDFGYPAELRFMFMESEVLIVFPRHTVEYIPEVLEKGKTWLQKFFSKVDRRLPMVGAGDLVQLENGEFRIIEFNFGTEGGEWDSAFSPVRGNQVTSILIGDSTPFMKDLERVFYLPLEKQKYFLEQVNGSLVKNGKEEVAVWLKDRYLEEWLRRSDNESFNVTMQKLRFLFETGYTKKNLGTELIKSAELFMKKRLETLN